jgi:bifunctional polynucleotide phosphatase/kinase
VSPGNLGSCMKKGEDAAIVYHMHQALITVRRYQIIIFTNQAGLKAPKKETANLKKFKLKVASVLKDLDIPLTLYAATENDHFRKPRTGMWGEMKDDYDLDAHGVDLEHSYLVGDAAGREGDFSDSDR